MTYRLRRICLGITLLWFGVGGLAHFIGGTAFFVRITPPWVPHPLLVVYLSGAIELLLCAAMLNLRLRPWAGWGLIALTCAVSFANIHMWQHPELFPEAPAWLYSLRLALQLGLLWVIWYGTRLPVASQQQPEPDAQRSSPSR